MHPPLTAPETRTASSDASSTSSPGSVGSEQHPRPPAPVSVGKYILQETLGRGATSKVKSAVHCETGEEVAIKIQAKKTMSQHELRTMALIIEHLKDKRNVVCLRELLASTRTVYMVLDKVDGGDLFDLIKEEGSLDEATARWIFSDVLRAMTALKRIGVAHRDIKPENVLIDRVAKVAKVADFGLAKVHNRIKGHEEMAELCTSCCGTLIYAAPELLAGVPYNAYKSDVYSLGVLLFATMSGRLPPVGPKTALKLPSDIACSEEVNDLLGQLTQPHPDHRIDMDSIFTHPWLADDAERVYESCASSVTL